MKTRDVERFGVLLRSLMDEQRLTYRALAERTRECDETGRGLTHAYLAELVARGPAPSPEATEVIAAALGVSPTVFAEYRLALARRAFDERLVSLERAHGNLDELLSLLEGRRVGLAAETRAGEQRKTIEANRTQRGSRQESVPSPWRPPRRGRGWTGPDG